MAREPFLINPKGNPKGKTRRTRARRRVARNRNPLGGELMVIGLGNPRRRTRSNRKGVNAVAKTNMRRHHKRRVSRRRRNVAVASNPRRRYVRRRTTHRRRYRRNPAGAAAMSLLHPKTWAPYVGTGALAAMTTSMAPRLFFGSTASPAQAYITQAGVAVAGSFLLPMVGLRRAHPMTWFITSGSVIVADVVGRYVARFLGLSAYPGYDASRRMYYPPATSSQMGVYPYQLYGGMDAYEQAPGVPAAPYEYAYGR